MGSTSDRTLAEARDTANDMRRAIARGHSPKEVLRIEKPGKTFAKYARECMEQKKTGWRNKKHASQWINTLEQYAFPFLGDKSIADIGEASGSEASGSQSIRVKASGSGLYSKPVFLAPNYPPFLPLFAFASRTILPTVVKCMLKHTQQLFRLSLFRAGICH